MADSSLDEQLAEQVARFYADPLGFVMFAYPWDSDPSIQICKLPAPWNLVYDSEFGPDAWACEFLDRLGQEVKARGFDGHVAVDPIKISAVSGHGVGKSALAAWLTDWIMSTRPDAQGTVTANTATQLSTKTWAQVTKWTNICITAHWFDITASRMTRKGHEATWFCTPQTCRAENSESFAGQHAPTSTSFYIFDEASAIEDIINEVSEGGLTDGEPMKFAFGNGTRNTGWFKDTFGKLRHRWVNFHVDARDVQITNKRNIEAAIKDHGLDSDYVKVRYRGLFPSQSVKQLISEADVTAAEQRHLNLGQYNFAPKILVLDNAWEGDDEGVIGLRQGLKFTILKTFAKNDNDVVIANLLAQLEDEHKADAVFIDAGYGTGVASIGATLGRSWTLVWFGGASGNPGCLNKRAEMWVAARDWLKAGGAIPNDPVLHADLIGPETVPRMDGLIQLESKKDMKRRQQPSPGRGDALALTFAFPVRAKALAHIGGAPMPAGKDYDPYANME